MIDSVLIEDLKRRDFIASTALADADLLRPDLIGLLMRRFRLVRPMLDWLCASVELEF